MADEVTLVEQMYADFARGDVGAVVAALADDVQWSEAEGHPWWPGQPLVGPQQVVEQVFARIPQEFDEFSIAVDRIVGLGGTVLMEGRYHGRAKATGKVLDGQVAHVCDVRDGKVVRFQQYADVTTWHEALGT